MAHELLDPVIHTQSRLRIMTTLTALPDGDRLTFPRLQGLLDATAEPLDPLRKLEDAGYVSVTKTPRGAPADHLRRGHAHRAPGVRGLHRATARAAHTTDRRRRPDRGEPMTTTTDLVIEAAGVTRRFGNTIALDDVS